MIGAMIAKQKISSAFDALNNLDVEAFLAVWRDECTFTYPGDIPVSGTDIQSSGVTIIKIKFGKAESVIEYILDTDKKLKQGVLRKLKLKLKIIFLTLPLMILPVS